jgi:hypothetical protein
VSASRTMATQLTAAITRLHAYGPS